MVTFKILLFGKELKEQTTVSHRHINKPLSTKSRLLTTGKKAFENITGKGENSGN